MGSLDMISRERRLRNMLIGPGVRKPKMKKVLKGGSKPRVSSTAREKAIASKAVKPKAKTKYGRVLARGQATRIRDRHPPKTKRMGRAAGRPPKKRPRPMSTS